MISGRVGLNPESVSTSPPRRLALGLGALSGWRRAGMALALGFAGFLAMPPIGLMPLLVFSLTGFIWLLDGASGPRRAFLDAWLWGMGFFVACLHWIAASMFVDIGQFWWMVPFSILGLPAAMSLYLAIALSIDRAISVRAGSWRIVAFAGWWTAAEWCRGHAFSGFPWLLAGYVWSGDAPPLLAVLQSASVIGIYSLSFMTVLVCALPASFGDDAPLGSRCAAPALGMALLAGAMIWGTARLSLPVAAAPDVTIRIVSTDLPHHAEPDRQTNVDDFKRALAIARAKEADGIDVAVWPEGDVPFPLNLDAGARDAVGATVSGNGIVLAGTVRVAGRDPEIEAWNNLAALTHDGRIIGSYDKHHLVPFGEYVPLHRFLNFSQIAAQRFDFSIGPGPRTMTLPNLPSVAPIICYEAIFPDEVVDEAHRPGWMVNITDDGWFGNSIGPAQHFAIARVRAVEEGLPLIRAANGGISASIDAYGRRLASSPIGIAATLDVKLPAPIAQNVFYVYHHKTLLLFLIIFPVLIGVQRKFTHRI